MCCRGSGETTDQLPARGTKRTAGCLGKPRPHATAEKSGRDREVGDTTTPPRNPEGSKSSHRSLMMKVLHRARQNSTATPGSGLEGIPVRACPMRQIPERRPSGGTRRSQPRDRGPVLRRTQDTIARQLLVTGCRPSVEGHGAAASYRMIRATISYDQCRAFSDGVGD